jgi:oligopeptidase B
VFHEPDGRFFLHCYRASSEQQLLLSLGSKTTSEVWVLDANQPAQAFVCMAPRVEGHEYSVDHGLLDGAWSWFIRTNRDGINFALFHAAGPAVCPSEAEWQNLFPTARR